MKIKAFNFITTVWPESAKEETQQKRTWSTMMILLSINLSSKYHQISLTRQFSACMGSSTLHSPPWITWLPVSVFPTHRHPRKNTPPKRNKHNLTHTQNRTHTNSLFFFPIYCARFKCDPLTGVKLKIYRRGKGRVDSKLSSLYILELRSAQPSTVKNLYEPGPH